MADPRPELGKCKGGNPTLLRVARVTAALVESNGSLLQGV